MSIVTDPILRGDPLWLALERAKTAIQEDGRLFVTKDPAYEQGLNTLRINSLASDAQLSERPVFELRNLVQGGVETDRWLKIHHPEIDEPIELKIWAKHGSPENTDKKASRVLAYLDAWQQKRALQLKPCTSRQLIRDCGKRFQVALSFSGDRRDFVKQVAHNLAAKLGRDRVLYDGYYEAEFARPNLDTHLQRLYHDESELIAVFLCAGYETKEWCGLEWRAIRDLIKQRQAESVMPLRFDMTEIPGLFSIDGYVWIGERPAEEIANVILQRLGNQSSSGTVTGATAEPSVSTRTIAGAGERFRSIREAFEEKLRQATFGGLSNDRGAIAICLVPDNDRKIDHAQLQNTPIPPPGLSNDGWDREIDQNSVVYFREQPADQNLSSFIRHDAVEIFTDGTILAADKWYIRRPGFPQMHSQDYISTTDFEKLVVEWLCRAAPAVQKLGIALPWRVGVSLIDIEGFYFLRTLVNSAHGLMPVPI